MHKHLAIETQLTREVSEEETLDRLGLVEHVLVHPRAAEQEHVRVVCNDAFDEAELN